jgi:hypothetical protein
MISGSGFLTIQRTSTGWLGQGTESNRAKPPMAQPGVKAQMGPRPKADKKRIRVKTTHTHNPIAQRRWRQLLSHVRPQSDSLYPIDTQNPTLATKQLLQLGNYLLSLQDELSEWPINKRHFVMMPSQLVIYQEERLSESEDGIYWAPSNILRYIDTPNNNRRWLQRPWRFLADLTQQLAREEKDIYLKVPLQAAQGLVQLLSFSMNPDLFDLERTCKKGITILHNHIQGAGLQAWSPAERNALAQTASRRGFDIRHNDEWCDYLAGLVDMLEQVASGLAESSKTSGQTPVKLGIASHLPDGRQYVHDLSDLFPGGSLTAVRPITPTDRAFLEKLFHQNDSTS